MLNKLLICLLAMLCITSSAISQEKSVYSELQKTFNLLNDTAVQLELELTEKQIREAKPLLQRLKRSKSALANDRHELVLNEHRNHLSDEEREEKLLRIKEATDEAVNAISEFLLPHQLERFQEIKKQMSFKNSSPTEFGILQMKEDLDLSPKKIGELKKAISETDKEFAEFLVQMRSRLVEERAKHRQKILSLLSEDQQQQFQATVGDEFLHHFRIVHWFSSKDFKGRLGSLKRDSNTD